MAHLRTTARTTMQHITNENNLLNPTEAGVKVVTGYLAADMDPGSWVIHDGANNQWVALNSETAANHYLSQVGIVLYKKRVNQTTGGLKTISMDYDVSEAEDKRVPICISGICAAKIMDLGTTCEVGQELMANSTSEFVVPQLGLTSTNAAFTRVSVATVADYVIDNDVFAIVGIGAFKGAIWGAMALNP